MLAGSSRNNSVRRGYSKVSVVCGIQAKTKYLHFRSLYMIAICISYINILK